MNLNDLFNEEKVRLDPKCWTGKKIGNPKTKVKGGVRVNNCVPAESALNEFAPVGGDDREPDEEEILRQLAAQWWNGTEQQMAKAQNTLAAMGWEIGQDESGDDDAGVFVIRAGDVNGDSYMAFNHSDLNLNEGSELKQAKRKYNQAAKDANADQVGAGKKIDTMKNSLRQKDINKQGMAEGSGEIRTAGRGAIRIPGDMSAPQWREPTWSFQEIAQKLGIPVSALNLLAFNRIGGFPEALPGLAARYGSKKYYKQSEIKRWVNANNVREKLKQGMAEGVETKVGRRNETHDWAWYSMGKDGKWKYGGDAKTKQQAQAKAQEYSSKQGVAEGEQQKGVDYRDPKEVDYDDEYDAMVARVKKLAGLGPMRTVYDPKKRQYRNIPTAVQPKK